MSIQNFYIDKIINEKGIYEIKFEGGAGVLTYISDCILAVYSFTHLAG